MHNTKKRKIVCIGLAAFLLMGAFLYIVLNFLSTKKGDIKEKMDVAECEDILKKSGTPPDIVEKIDLGFKQYLGEKMHNKKESFQYYGQEVPFTEDGVEELYIYTTTPQPDHGRERARIYIYFNWDKSDFSFSDDVSFKFELFPGWEMGGDTPEFWVDMLNGEDELMACDRFDLWDLGSNQCRFLGNSVSVGRRSFKGFTNLIVENIAETGEEEPATTALSVQFEHNGSAMARTTLWKKNEQTAE